MHQKLAATHGTISSLGNDYFGYYGWPSVAATGTGTLYAVASGLRNAHVCPYGRTALFISRDEGNSWSSPRIINDSPFDDRDAGIISLQDTRLLVSWFTSDNRDMMIDRIENADHKDAIPEWHSGMRWMTDEDSPRFCGAWISTSDDAGGTWNRPIRVPVNTPHGPIVLRDGAILYFGKLFGMNPEEAKRIDRPIRALRSVDSGKTWETLGDVPNYPGTVSQNYHEPHVVELSDGTLIGHIRVQNFGESIVSDVGITPFSIMQSESVDGGRTWSDMRPLGFHGSPPHLLRHSSGTLICTYGRRQEPYGQRVALSTDGGKSWEHDFVLRDDGPTTDLGYPCSIELGNGDIYTVYYQKQSAEDKCGLMWSRWQLP